MLCNISPKKNEEYSILLQTVFFFSKNLIMISWFNFFSLFQLFHFAKEESPTPEKWRCFSQDVQLPNEFSCNEILYIIQRFTFFRCYENCLTLFFEALFWLLYVGCELLKMSVKRSIVEVLFISFSFLWFFSDFFMNEWNAFWESWENIFFGESLAGFRWWGKFLGKFYWKFLLWTFVKKLWIWGNSEK